MRKFTKKYGFYVILAGLVLTGLGLWRFYFGTDPTKPEYYTNRGGIRYFVMKGPVTKDWKSVKKKTSFEYSFPRRLMSPDWDVNDGSWEVEDDEIIIWTEGYKIAISDFRRDRGGNVTAHVTDNEYELETVKYEIQVIEPIWSIQRFIDFKPNHQFE